MFMIKKSVLFSVLMAATTTTAKVFDDNPGRIVGGTSANPGDYPYFVEMGNCGGTLIAPDMVLFAAHCRDWKDKQLNVGAFLATTVAEGSQVRYCAEWKADPKFGTEGSAVNYDFALCRLDEPVFVDESNVKLELNDNDAVPREDKNLIAIGVGRLTQGGAVASVLQDVRVPAITNDQCKQYYGNAVTKNMLCAGFQEGGKDSCQGDSGGPIVERTVNNDGTIVDTHVGVVSWGEGCASKNKPGVYARTSKRSGWITATICNDLQSVAPFCSNNNSDPSPAVPCDQDLAISVTTDKYAYETKWTLEDSNKRDVLTRQYLINDYDNEHKLCLKSNECYEWTIKDENGDGLCTNGKCGSYSFTLNGEEIVSGSGDFKKKKSEKFCTGDGDNNTPDSTPTKSPVRSPTKSPVSTPTKAPTTSPTKSPVSTPTKSPTTSPTKSPTTSPTKSPTTSPTKSPVRNPTKAPTASPTKAPVTSPTRTPVQTPTISSSGACGGNDAVRFQLELHTDDYGEETSWFLSKISDDHFEVEFSGSDYQSNQQYTLPVVSNSYTTSNGGGDGDDYYYCLEDNSCYLFQMLDSYGDGLTSGPNGFYEGTLDGTTVFGGNVDFGELDEQTFCVGSNGSGSVGTTFEPTESPTFTTTESQSQTYSYW